MIYLEKFDLFNKKQKTISFPSKTSKTRIKFDISNIDGDKVYLNKNTENICITLSGEILDFFIRKSGPIELGSFKKSKEEKSCTYSVDETTKEELKKLSKNKN